MPYQKKTFEEIEAEILTDYGNLDADLDLTPGSDPWIRAVVLAKQSEGLHDYLEWVTRQIFPDTADLDELLHHCRIHGLERQGATKAGGIVTFFGTEGAVIPEGQEIARTADGVRFRTTAIGVLPAPPPAPPEIDVPVVAFEAGEAGNGADGEAFTVVSPPAGVMPGAMSKTLFSGGCDEESQTALLQRLLLYIRIPRAGGKAADYYRWVLEIEYWSADILADYDYTQDDLPADAVVAPLRRGLGTCDVAIVGPGHTAPGPTLVAACQEVIDANRPVTARDCLAVEPDEIAQSVSIQVDFHAGYTLIDVTQPVRDAVAAYFGTLLPGDDLIHDELEDAVGAVEGVKHRIVITPAADVTTEVSILKFEWVLLDGVPAVAEIP